MCTEVGTTNGFALNHDKSLQIYFLCFVKRQAKKKTKKKKKKKKKKKQQQQKQQQQQQKQQQQKNDFLKAVGVALKYFIIYLCNFISQLCSVNRDPEKARRIHIHEWMWK